ncbi:MAG: head-tail connector protein [Synergistaceae bacterium]|jgi:hypothetical protein|nr:head-tail connector protein [Synergistaceae bacterium]
MKDGKKTKGKHPKIKALAKRLFFMRAQQEKIVPVWREISNYVAPNRGAFDYERPNQGLRRDTHLVDSTPTRALGILQAGMQGGLTSPSRAWCKLQVSDPDLAAIPAVMVWTDEVTDRILNVIGRSNLYNCLHGIYGEIAAFGIGALYIEDDWEEIVHGKLMTAGEYYVAFSSRDKPNAFGRVLWMTAAQMKERFGEDNLSEQVKQALNGNTPEEWFKVNHFICEDEDHDTRFPFMSVYWEEGKDTELGLGGYEEFPVLIPRWETIASDFYGYGPGWLALGESRTLQEMRKDYLVAQQLNINPPVYGPESARNQRVNIFPGGINFVTSDVGLKPVFQVNSDIQGQLVAIGQSQQMINQMFFGDLFLMIASMDNRNMTATEVQVRQEEKMQMLGPVIERLEHELLDPLIVRTFSIMFRRGMFPEPPEELMGREIKIEYISLLALAQKAGGLTELQNLLALVGGIAGMSPEVVDKLNADEFVDQFIRLTNIPSVLIRSDEEVAALRDARAAQMQQAQQMASMSQMAASGAQAAGAVKDLSTADLSMLNGVMSE